MPQSLSETLIHAELSTKDRAGLIPGELQEPLHAFLAGVCRKAGCEELRVGGVSDHVHLAIRLSRTITIAALIEDLKTASSKWIKSQSAGLAEFRWQRGYGAFSIGFSQLPTLARYIDSQPEHHRQKTVQDETMRRALLSSAHPSGCTSCRRSPFGRLSPSSCSRVFLGRWPRLVCSGPSARQICG